MTTGPAASGGTEAHGEAEQQHADVCVVFGITGDLARVMTFRALHRLEQRDLLSCRVVGVAFDNSTLSTLWSGPASRSSQRASRSTRPCSSASPRSSRTSMETSLMRRLIGRVAEGAISGASLRLLPRGPALALRHGGLGPRRRRGPHEGRTGRRWRSPSGTTLRSAREFDEQLHALIDESQLYRIDHFLGKMSVEDIAVPPLREHHPRSRSGTGNTSRPVADHDGGEHFGVADRGAFYDSGGRAARRRPEPPAAGAEPGRHGAARTGRGPDVLSDRKRDVFVAMADARPGRRTWLRPVPTATSTSPGVAPDSQTETFCALRLEIDNWRWSGVPFFIRAGKVAPVTVTEVRVVFNTTPLARLRARRDAPAARGRTSSCCGSGRARARGCRHAGENSRTGLGLRPVQLDMDFASMGGEGPTALRGAPRTRRCVGDSSHFTRQDALRRRGGSCSRYSTPRRRSKCTNQARGGRSSADNLVDNVGGL